MKKLITLIAVLSLVFVTPVLAGSGGEGNNTGCNGQGNANSPCAGNGGNGGNVTVKDSGNSTNKISNDIKNTINASSKNNLNNRVNTGDVDSSSSNTVNANNDGVSVDASDNSVYEEADIPPMVAPVFGQRGQVGFTFNTPVGGAGFQKDTKDAKLIDTGAFIQQASQAELMDKDLAKEATLNIVNKLLKRSCGKKCMVGQEEELEVADPDKEITGNGGNL
jgi:hypothetical protein